jgi:hypothetical protein
VSEVEASIRAVAELDLAYEPTPWPFADARADEIEAHWAQRKAALPRLFNGRVLLSGSHAFARRDDGAMVLRASYFATDYKAFLTWRDLGFPDAKVCNCFSMAALRASDGATPPMPASSISPPARPTSTTSSATASTSLRA